MSATGFPNRVTRRGRPVRLTRSRTARQVALNLDIGMESTVILTMVNLSCEGKAQSRHQNHLSRGPLTARARSVLLRRLGIEGDRE